MHLIVFLVFNTIYTRTVLTMMWLAVEPINSISDLHTQECFSCHGQPFSNIAANCSIRWKLYACRSSGGNQGRKSTEVWALSK